MAKSKQERNNAGLPAGFKRVESAGSFPENHDFKKDPVIMGKVTAMKTTERKRGKKTEKTRIMYIANKETGEVRAVWESHALAALFDEAKVGNSVYIKSLGVKKLPGKKTLKQFDTAIGA